MAWTDPPASNRYPDAEDQALERADAFFDWSTWIKLFLSCFCDNNGVRNTDCEKQGISECVHYIIRRMMNQYGE